MDSTQQPMNPPEAEENEETREREVRKAMAQILEAFDSLPPGIDRRPFFRMSIRPFLQEMAPMRRRELLDELRPYFTGESCGNGTGAFFCALAGADGVREPDFAGLGKRIMKKRNPHYQE